MLSENIDNREDIREEDSGAEDEVLEFQEKAEVDHQGVNHRPLDRGPAEVVPLEDGVADYGETEEKEGGYGSYFV